MHRVSPGNNLRHNPVGYLLFYWADTTVLKPEGSRALRLCLHGRRYAEFVVNEICLHGRRYANSSGTKFGRNSQVNTGIVGRQCVAMASISRSLRVRDPQKIYPRSMWNVDVGVPNLSGTKFGRNGVNITIAMRLAAWMQVNVTIASRLPAWTQVCRIRRERNSAARRYTITRPPSVKTHWPVK